MLMNSFVIYNSSTSEPSVLYFPEMDKYLKFSIVLQMEYAEYNKVRLFFLRRQVSFLSAIH